MSDEENEELRTMRTEYLGQFDELEVPIIVELLAGHDITAMPKLAFEQNRQTAYPGMDYEKGEVLVEAGKVAEARAIIDSELPQHLAAIEASMDALEDPEEPA